jgi:hypothetical protein
MRSRCRLDKSDAVSLLSSRTVPRLLRRLRASFGEDLLMGVSLKQWMLFAAFDWLLKSAYLLFVGAAILAPFIAALMTAVHLTALCVVRFFIRAAPFKGILVPILTNLIFAGILTWFYVSLYRRGSVTECFNNECWWLNGTITPLGSRVLALQIGAYVGLNLLTFMAARTAECLQRGAPGCKRRQAIAWPSVHQIIVAITMRLFACLALLTGLTASSWADDTPKASCQSISEWAVEIRTNDLSSLSQTQQSNIAYYLAEQSRENKKIPAILPIFNDREKEISFSLIFPYGGCPHSRRCIGTAVFPESGGIKLKKFSYRKNFVITPATTTSQRNISLSVVLFDEDEKSFLQFYDVYKMPELDGNGKIKRSDYVRSEYSHLTVGSLKDNYLACLLNIFNVRDMMPGSGGR